MKNLRLRHFDGFIVLTVVFLFVAAMFSHAQVSGQQGAYTNNVQMAEHPAHANYSDLRTETSLLGNNGVTVAQGERPLSDFPTYKVETPLGDVAREYREEHAKAEKATIHFEEQ